MSDQLSDQLSHQRDARPLGVQLPARVDPEPQLAVALLGLSGYGSVQLLSLLSQHPRLKLAYVADRQRAGQRLSEAFPHLGDRLDSHSALQIQAWDAEAEPAELLTQIAACDLVFLALGHGLAHRFVPALLGAGQRVIDLSADYRFRDLAVYSACYGLERTAGGQGQGLDQEAVQASVYGLPELYRDRLPAARLVAVPGCYSTASLLAIAPLLKRGLIQPETLIIDAKLGGSGLAQALQPQVRLAEVEQSIAAYGVARHRQTPEIEQICSELLGHDVMVQFTPHLVPRVRGLLSTVYGTLRDPGLVREDLLTIYRAFYQRSPWVRILPANTYPQTQWTWGTNRCDIGIEVDSRTGRVIVMGAIDNLMKGEASQAVQCLNLMMGWDETLGLSTMALFP